MTKIIAHARRTAANARKMVEDAQAHALTSAQTAASLQSQLLAHERAARRGELDPSASSRKAPRVGPTEEEYLSLQSKLEAARVQRLGPQNLPTNLRK